MRSSEQLAASRGASVESSSVDKLDHAIIDHLEHDGRLTNAELAERVRLSPSACLRRVRALEAQNVIAGYHAVVDPQAVGRGFQVLVSTTLMLRNRESIAAFEAAVAQLDEVVECHRMFGDPDYVIRVAVADAQAYERFLIDTFADLPGVARMTSQFAMKTIKAAGPLPFRALS
jgi:Lrp/AsnC family transcriptional regulator, leucine-responsive regulatory protein